MMPYISEKSNHFQYTYKTIYQVYILQSVNVCEPWHVISNSGILTSVDSDKPVQPSFKLRNSK